MKPFLLLWAVSLGAASLAMGGEAESYKVNLMLYQSDEVLRNRVPDL